MDRTDGDFSSAKTLLSEQSSSRVDYALKAGLAKNPNKLNFYKRVLNSPSAAVSDPQLRPYAADLLTSLVDLVLNDTTIWNRSKTIWLRNKKSVRGLREDISDTGLRSLIEKARDHECPLEVILEVYSRGALGGNQASGFNRVNSFLAGGKAAEMDADLLGEEVQKERKHEKTLSVVKRVLRESRK